MSINDDLSNVNLNEVFSEGISGNPILPEKYDLKEGYIFGPNVNLTKSTSNGYEGINLSHVTDLDLSNLDLSGANLSKLIIGAVNFNNTNFTGADL